MYSMYGWRILIQSFSSWYEGDSSKSRDLSNALTHLLTVYDLCKSVQCALCIVQIYGKCTMLLHNIDAHNVNVTWSVCYLM
jgi:hypothetical protein